MTARDELLRHALEIHADTAHHPDEIVAEACRTILRLTKNDEQYREAFRTLQMLDQLEKMP